MPSHTPKRVRTGCLKCRVRRRKCDEGKPQCQRCTDGGFECQYGTRLSFLQKNAITAQAEASGSSAAYRRVQFVPASVAQPSKSGPARPASSSTADLRIVQELPYAEPEVPVTTCPADPPTARRHTVASPPRFDRPERDEAPVTSPQSNYSWSEGFAPTGGYEIALDALLSLGEDKGGTPTDRGPTPEPRTSPGGLLPNVNATTPREVSGGYAGGSRGNPQVADNEWPLGFSESNILGLLRYYRYEVAPWLDICDLGHTFGLTVLCLTAASVPVLRSVIDFTASLTGQAGALEGARGANTSLVVASDTHAAQFNEADLSTRLLCRVLSVSKQILTSDLGGSPNPGINELAELFNTSPLLLTGRPLNIALYYLTLRFDLSESLVSAQPPRLPLWAPNNLSPDTHRSDSAASVFRSASEILVLCARAARLVFGSDPEPRAESRVGQWTSLLDGLNAWYAARHQKLRPMVEVDLGGDGGFPLLLFTSGAGLLANQLYHTAMLLLLQNKPRTFRVSGRGVSEGMSALWHAGRVCGMALANDARECWDPSLVASFVFAARGMTHADQHRMLLEKLEEVGRLTGWKVGYYRSLLMEEWGI